MWSWAQRRSSSSTWCAGSETKPENTQRTGELSSNSCRPEPCSLSSILLSIVLREKVWKNNLCPHFCLRVSMCWYMICRFLSLHLNLHTTCMLFFMWQLSKQVNTTGYKKQIYHKEYISVELSNTHKNKNLIYTHLKCKQILATLP